MSAVFAALLSIAAVGCGCPEPMELTENREGTLVAAQVAAARDENSNDEARCAWELQRPSACWWPSRAPGLPIFAVFPR